MASLTCRAVTAISESIRRRWPLYLGATFVALLAWSAFEAHGGTPEPTASEHLSHGAVVLDSGLLVFREGLETILVLAAVTASMVGASQVYRKPVALGAGVGFAASVGTWFLAAWVLGQLGGSGLAVQAATGLLAVIVLLVVMNWFFHKIYWTGWISARNRQRKRVLDRAGIDSKRATLIGADPARRHLGLPRGLRGRPLPPEPAADLRRRGRARGRRPRAGADRGWSAASPSSPSASSTTSGCWSSPGSCSASS